MYGDTRAGLGSFRFFSLCNENVRGKKKNTAMKTLRGKTCGNGKQETRYLSNVHSRILIYIFIYVYIFITKTYS